MDTVNLEKRHPTRSMSTISPDPPLWASFKLLFAAILFQKIAKQRLECILSWEVWMRKIDIENVRQGSLAPISESEKKLFSLF